MLNLSSTYGKKVVKRLKEELVAWLTTVRPDGTPDPNPVWFLWDGETFLIYSQPTAYKFHNLASNPHVSINLNSDAYGGEVAVFTGVATLDPDAPPADQNPEYLEKYRTAIADINMTPESFAESYSRAIRVRPERIRGF